jgi:hypothetical protein
VLPFLTTIRILRSKLLLGNKGKGRSKQRCRGNFRPHRKNRAHLSEWNEDEWNSQENSWQDSFFGKGKSKKKGGSGKGKGSYNFDTKGKEVFKSAKEKTHKHKVCPKTHVRMDTSTTVEHSVRSDRS